MDDTATTLRELLQRNRPRTASLGWPPDLRVRVARHAAGRRARGEGWAAIGNSLGISRSSVRGWVEALDVIPATNAMVPVIVSDAPQSVPTPTLTPTPTPTPTSMGRDLVLVSPRGYRLEGLSVNAAITALERLG